jgi:hypothetical protein
VRRRRAFVAVLAALLSALPALAQACAACGVGNGRNKAAFFVTTVFLSLLPLGIIAAILFWLARNGRAFIATEFRESDEGGPPVAAAPDPESGPAGS